MSFNGSGTFVINSAGQPVVSGTVISSTAFNALTADLANGLSTCITKDGQTTPTANIPMGSNKITGLAVGTAAADAATLGQVQSTAAKLLASVSGADTITAQGAPTLAAYAAGQMFYFVAAGANTGAVTINIDSLGAKNITRDGTTALAAGDIQSGEVCVIVYDGTQFQLVNGASQSASIVTENLTVNKATVLNESGGDNDTRIEGDTDANLFFVDASADAVGIGTSGPVAKLDVAKTSNDTISRANAVGAFGDYQSLGAGLLLQQTLSSPFGFALQAANAANSVQFPLLLNPSGGNVGVGVTPSAWASGSKAIEIGAAGTAVWNLNQTNTSYTCNAYYDGAYKYGGTGLASAYQQAAGLHYWYTAPSGTAGNNITFTQAMTLDASGNLGVGITSPTQPLHVSSGTQNTARFQNPDSGEAAYISCVNTTDNKTAYFGIDGTGLVGADAGAALIASSTGEPIILAPALTERARITSGGDLLVKTTSTTASGDGVIGFGSGGYVIGNVGLSVANNGTLDISTNTSGGGYQGFLTVANTVVGNSVVRTQATYSVFGLGTENSIQTIHSANGSGGGASFTVTIPSNGVIRVTNTSGSATDIYIQFFGGRSR